jgi:SAM-dependent methyltransferase
MTTSEPLRSPAEAYHAYYGPAIVDPLSDRLLALAPPSVGDRVLDVACGTGILTRKLAHAAGSAGCVVGVDVNPKMVEVAQGLGDTSINYRQGDGTALDLADDSFDALYCQQGLQFFPDPAAGAREMQRVLARGGRAVVACWRGLDAHPFFEALADAEQPHLVATGVQVDRAELIAPFTLGDREEFGGLFRNAGFSNVEIHEVPIDARFADADRFVEHMEYGYAAVVPQFAEDPAKFAAYLEAVNRETRDLVAAYRQGDEVVVPMRASVAVATN